MTWVGLRTLLVKSKRSNCTREQEYLAKVNIGQNSALQYWGGLHVWNAVSSWSLWLLLDLGHDTPMRDANPNSYNTLMAC